jgi:hypothetical protein
MNPSTSILTRGTASDEVSERYEVVDGVRVEQQPMGAFETYWPRGCAMSSIALRRGNNWAWRSMKSCS